MRRLFAVGLIVVALGCTSGDESSTTTARVVSSMPESERSLPEVTLDGETTAPMKPTASSVVDEQQPGALSAEAQEELGPVEAPRTGGESLGPLGGTQVMRETEAGTVQIGGGEVPPSAAAIPLPDGFELQLATETEAASGFSGVASTPVAEVADFFRSELPVAGYRIVSEDTPVETVVLMVIEGPGASGDIAVSGSPNDDVTTVVVSLTLEG